MSIQTFLCHNILPKFAFLNRKEPGALKNFGLRIKGNMKFTGMGRRTCKKKRPSNSRRKQRKRTERKTRMLMRHGVLERLPTRETLKINMNIARHIYFGVI
jgi:hypothetical protein